MKWRIYKERPQGGFWPPKMRHEHVTRFVPRALNLNVDFTKHSTGKWTQALFFFSSALEVVYMVQPLHRFLLEILVNHYFLNLCLDFFFLHIFFCSMAINCTCSVGSYFMYRVQRSKHLSVICIKDNVQTEQPTARTTNCPRRENTHRLKRNASESYTSVCLHECVCLYESVCVQIEIMPVDFLYGEHDAGLVLQQGSYSFFGLW